MNLMKIELKKIEFNERMSEETNCFSADLYINGKHIGEASNRGHGGPTDYHSINKEGHALIKEAEAYCKTLPPYTYEMSGENHSIEMDLEMLIDDLITKYLQDKELQKFRKSMERAMVKGLVIGKPDESFDTISFKVPLETIMAAPNKPEVMVNIIKKYVIPELADGKMLLNTNIPDSYLEQAGLTKDQYQPFKKTETNSKKSNLRKGKGIK